MLFTNKHNKSNCSEKCYCINNLCFILIIYLLIMNTKLCFQNEYLLLFTYTKTHCFHKTRTAYFFFQFVTDSAAGISFRITAASPPSFIRHQSLTCTHSAFVTMEGRRDSPSPYPPYIN